MNLIIIFVQTIGAKQPNYLVTADDVDTLLAIEVQPLDNRKRKVLLSPHLAYYQSYTCLWEFIESVIKWLVFSYGFIWYATHPKKAAQWPDKEVRMSISKESSGGGI